MISRLLKRAKLEACRQLVVELFKYNRKDGCWDPIGSIDKRGLDRTLEAISKGTLKDKSVREAKQLFSKGQR